MSLKKINPTESAFFYNPRGKEFYLVSELKFYFNKDSRQFELDQNPHGEPKFTKINGLIVNTGFSEMEFDAVYRSKDTHFKFSSDYNCDKILYKTIAGISKSGFAFRDDDRDKIELIFNKGIISKIYLYKHVDNKLVDSLSITREEGVFYLIKQKPWARIALDGIVVRDNRIICRAGTEETIYGLDDQEFIWDTLSGLIQV